MKVFFLGWEAQYEKHFIRYLADHYAVEHLESPNGLRLLQRITRKLVRAYRGNLFGRIYCRMKKFGGSDLLICNETRVTYRLNSEIINAFPGKKVLLVRDLVDAPFLEKWRAVFGAIYSFDREQCAKHGMGYLDQFMPIGYKEPSQASSVLKKSQSALTASFIGREKGRGATLLYLAGMLENCGCNIDFRIVVDKSTAVRTTYHIDSTIDYYKLLEATLQADVLIEINQPGQSGFTLRTLEAAYYGKKLIANNQAIKETPLYHPNNVLVLDDTEAWSADMFHNFLALPLQPVAQEVLYKYSPDFMLESLMASHGVAA